MTEVSAILDELGWTQDEEGIYGTSILLENGAEYPVYLQELIIQGRMPGFRLDIIARDFLFNEGTEGLSELLYLVTTRSPAGILDVEDGILMISHAWPCSSFVGDNHALIDQIEVMAEVLSGKLEEAIISVDLLSRGLTPSAAASLGMEFSRDFAEIQATEVFPKH